MDQIILQKANQISNNDPDIQQNILAWNYRKLKNAAVKGKKLSNQLGLKKNFQELFNLDKRIRKMFENLIIKKVLVKKKRLKTLVSVKSI